MGRPIFISDTNIQEESSNNPEFEPPAKIRVVDIADKNTFKYIISV